MAYTDIVEIGIDEELIQGQGYEIKIPFGVGWVTEWFQPGLTSQVTENLWQLYTNCGWDVHSIIVDANTTYVFGIWQGSDNTWENIWSYFENVFTDKGKKAFLVSLSNTGFITGMPPGITIDQLKSMTPAQINKLYNDLYGELQGVKTNVRGQVKWNVAIICGTIIFVTGAVVTGTIYSIKHPEGVNAIANSIKQIKNVGIVVIVIISLLIVWSLLRR